MKVSRDGEGTHASVPQQRVSARQQGAGGPQQAIGDPQQDVGVLQQQVDKTQQAENSATLPAPGALRLKRKLPHPRWLAVTAIALAIWAVALGVWWTRINAARTAQLVVPVTRATPVSGGSTGAPQQPAGATLMPAKPVAGPSTTPIPHSTPVMVPVTRQAGPLVANEDWLSLAQAFDTDRALAYIAELTQPRYTGRAVGSPGGKLAADWIAERFADYGLQPAGDNGTYFQEFAVPYAELTAMPSFELLDSYGKTLKEYRIRTDYTIWPGGYSDGGWAEGPVVWVSNGTHEDYRGIDADGAIVLCRWRYPLQQPLREALEHGAEAIIFIRSDYPFRMRRTAREDALLPQGIPTLLIGSTVLDDLLDGSGMTADDLSIQYKSRLLASHVRIDLPLEYDETATGRNVLGVLPGSDPDGQNQIVIIGGHYDHMGADPDGTKWFGANDNASGVAVLLEIARQWQEVGYVPKRTVLFAGWDGEEIGLNGSTFYVQHPSYPLSATVGMLQLDMVGAGPNDLLIDPGGLVADQSLASAATLGMRVQAESMGASDHVPFAEAGVPATLYIWWDGTTPGIVYHVPEDDINNIEVDKLQAAGQLTDLVLLALSWEQEELEDLVTELQGAVAASDAASFLRILDPYDVLVQREQESWFAAVRARQPAEFALSSGPAIVAGDMATSTLTIRYRWDAADPQYSTSVPVRWVRQNSTWYYSGPAWDETTGQRVSVQHMQQPQLAEEVLPIAEALHARLERDLGLELPDPIVIYLHSTVSLLRVLQTPPAGQVDATSWAQDNRVVLSQSRALTTTLAELALQRVGWSPDRASWLAQGLSDAWHAAESTETRQEVEAKYIPLILWADGSGSLWEEGDMPSRWQVASDEQELWAAQAWAMSQPLVEAGNLHNPSADIAAWRIAQLTPWRSAAEEIRDTLAQRVRAVLERDEAAFLATVDAANPVLYNEEKHWFADLTDHPAKTFSLEGQLLRLENDLRQTDGDAQDQWATVQLQMKYHLESNSSPVTVNWQARFVQRNGRWLYADVDFFETASEHFRLKYGRTLGTQNAQTLLADAEQAHAMVTKDLGMALAAPIEIKYYDDPEVFRSSIFLSMSRARGWNEPGESIKLTNIAAADVGGVIAHELTHHALFAKGVQHGGVHEGTAQYEAGLYNPQWRNEQIRKWRQQVYDVVRSKRPITLADLTDWRQWQPQDPGLIYTMSWDIVEYFRQHYGRDAFLRWLDALGSNLSFEEAFLQATGTSFSSFDAAWRESVLRGHIGNQDIETAQAFSGERALEHVQVLARSECAGREAGTAGNEAATRYIAEKLAQYGVQPAGDDGSYLQRFLISPTRLTTTPVLTLVTADGQTQDLRYRLDFREVLGRQAGGGQVEQGIVYARDLNLDDARLGGRVLLVRAGTDALLDAQAAEAHGAGALLLITNKWTKDMLAKSNEVTALSASTIPVYELTKEASDLIFTLAGYNPAQLEKSPPLLPLPLSARIGIELEVRQDVSVANVLGVLPGSAPQRADEVLVLAAHFDHVGCLPDGTVYPGANNDASGVAVLLELARLWQERGYRPHRTVLFAAWNATELGGLGSSYYAAHPIIYPLERIRALIHLDMIGQGRGFYIDVAADEQQDALILAHLDNAARQVEGRLNWNKYQTGNDADPFHRFGIPAAKLTWERPEYVNEPQDTADLIDVKKLQATGRLIALALMTMADE